MTPWQDLSVEQIAAACFPDGVRRIFSGTCVMNIAWIISSPTMLKKPTVIAWCLVRDTRRKQISRARDEGRAFLKGLFERPADILPDKMAEIISVNFHPMANPRFNRALNELCEMMNQEEFLFPQTRLKIVFGAMAVASGIAPYQEF
ncbi:MAG: hypothetical protein RBT11_13860 [Desulfobacterales bacterium]|jgi:hypothetical protein|nr:hypothetical protein [Desulfobacterales bacterium]